MTIPCSRRTRSRLMQWTCERWAGYARFRLRKPTCRQIWCLVRFGPNRRRSEGASRS
jgi:hypothetical protein